MLLLTKVETLTVQRSTSDLEESNRKFCSVNIKIDACATPVYICDLAVQTTFYHKIEIKTSFSWPWPSCGFFCSNERKRWYLLQGSQHPSLLSMKMTSRNTHCLSPQVSGASLAFVVNGQLCHTSLSVMVVETDVHLCKWELL